MRKLRMGMIGGGGVNSVGPYHALAAELCGSVELVAGVFSRDAERSRVAAGGYRVAEDRCYPGVDEMLAAEALRADPIDFVTVATPNDQHATASKKAIAAGVHVLCDKPPTTTLVEALDLAAALERSSVRYALTFTYNGFPMLREARARIAAGEIGTVRKVVVTFLQEWLATPVEAASDAAAQWRMDPKRSGIGGCSADIGVHAFNLAEYVSGLEVEEICADVNALVPNRALDDDCNVLLHFRGGAVGVLNASQVAFGERSTTSIAVYGERGAVVWNADRLDELRVVRGDAIEILTRHGRGKLTDVPLPRRAGNAFIAAFTAIYGDFARAITTSPELIDAELSGIRAGVRAMRFVERAVRGSAERRGWERLE